MASESRSRRWLFGPAPDLLLGCGAAYAVVFAALVVAGPEIRAVLPLGLLPLVSVFAGTPHYGATLLRVYERPSERRAYVFFAVHLTLAIWALYYAGLYSAALGTFLLTLYLTWSPWHYTGQNYGIALLFVRRRGVQVTPGLKRLIYASFIVSYLLTFLAIHGATQLADYAPIQSYGGSIYDFFRLGIPSPWWEGAFLAAGAVYLATTGAAAVLLLRRAPARDLLPSALLVLTQALWFSLPPLAHKFGWLGGVDPLSLENAAFLFVWIGAGHAVQYLWVTTYFAQGTASARGKLRYYLKCIFAGSAIWSIPAALYVNSGLQASRFGGMASGIDAAVLLAAVVNIHHFVLDGAIWKLRDGHVANVLIRRRPETAAAVGTAPERSPRLLRYAAYAFLAFGVYWSASTTSALLIKEFGVNRALARGDLAAASTALDRLAWIGRDGAGDYLRLAHAAAQRGDARRAFEAYRESLARGPRAGTWVAMGQLRARTEGPAAAVPDYERALELDPNSVGALSALGTTLLRLDEPARAEKLLARAVALAPEQEVTRLAYERARRRSEADAAPGS